MEICFPGGQRVEALHQGFWIRTDQPVSQGGGGEAPSPFDLFLASVGTCAGFYTLRFCQQRNLPTEGLALTMTAERDAERKRVVCIHIEISLPAGFPKKYREAILHAVDSCSVKRHLAHPPSFQVILAEPPEDDAVEETEEQHAPVAHPPDA